MSIFKVPSITTSIFNTTLEPRIYDINYGNHLGHDSLISLLHEARMRFLKQLGYSELNIEGLGILVTNLVVNYLGEAFYGDKLTINIGLGDVSKTSIDIIYEVKNDEKAIEVARALTTITFYDYTRKRVAKIPQGFLTKVR